MKGNLSKLVEEVTERSPEKVFLQIPEGLKTRVQNIQEGLGEEGIKSVASLEPCYGACDLRDHEAKRLGCDLLVHVGHTEFCDEEEVETLYFPWYHDVDPVPALSSNMDKLEGCSSIGLVASANFLPALEDVKDFLQDEDVELFSGEGKRTEEGQILGCDVSGALKVEEDVDCYLYLGSGRFHPLGLAKSTEKPVYVLDFERGELYTPDFENLKKQRILAMEKAKECEKFGILLSTKKGQARPDRAEEIKDKLEKKGKDAWIFSMDEITPRKLEGIKVDCGVNTACPRIAVEHRTDFEVPILNAEELDEIFNF